MMSFVSLLHGLILCHAVKEAVEDDQGWEKEHAIWKHCEQVSKWPSIEERWNIRWMGSVRDNCIWANSEICLGKDKDFDQQEYFSSAVMIPTFKKGYNLSKER